VYLARDAKHGRRVALKILRPELAGSVAHERFLREIRVAAGLQHSNILPLYDSGETTNSLYFVMPYMEGESLRERMTREARMTLADCVAVIREVADALTFAHERGVVHRDVKPENIILGAGGHAFIGDFGVAQALTVATLPGISISRSGDRLTGGGLVVGTLPYMSPEQLTGDERVDGRSDQYSLACVFFEMMTKHTPHTGNTPLELIRQQMENAPKRIREHRRDVSRRVDAVLTRALSPEPEQRFATVREFAEELARVAATSSAEVRRQRLVAWMGGAASVAAAVMVFNWVRIPDHPPLDPSLYAVLPFQHDSAAEHALGGDQCQLLLSTAFSHWRGLRLVDYARSNSAYMQVVGDFPPTLEGVLAAAKVLRAGNAAWGSVTLVGDSIYVRAALYDVASGESIREYQIVVAAGLDGLPSKFRQLADTLLLHVAGAPRRADAMGTSSLEAWRAYSEGHRALAIWDLPAAHTAFRRATELDPDFAHAWLWLVQSTTWSRTFARAAWRDAAAQLVAVSDGLPPNERESARALLEVAEGRFQEACQRYRALIAEDSLNFAAWFGLGECQSLDRLVVQDRASPSGWRFRSSQHSAIQAYRRALSLTPASFMAFRGRGFDRLESLLFANPGNFKQGFLVAGNDTTVMGAFPSLNAAGDTIEFVPFTLAQLFDFGEARPATMEAALARNRRVLLEVTETWTRAFPRSADAIEAHARALELAGALTSPRNANARARYLEARSLSEDANQRTRLAVGEVRVLLKSRDFATAGRLADSIATAPPQPDGGAADPAMRAPMATCDACGKATEVPFQPTSGKPVYCSDCYRERRAAGGGYGGGGSRGGSGSRY
jgi:serine/threonine-protein kinase